MGNSLFVASLTEIGKYSRYIIYLNTSNNLEMSTLLDYRLVKQYSILVFASELIKSIKISLTNVNSVIVAPSRRLSEQNLVSFLCY